MKHKRARSKNSCAYGENWLNSLRGFRGLSSRQSIRFPLARKFPFLNIRIVVPHGFADGLGERGIAADEAGMGFLGEAEHIVHDEHLPIAVRPGANADG